MSYPDYDTPRLRGVLAEIHAEREAQDAKFGQQDHPDGTGLHADWTMFADYARKSCQEAATKGELAWDLILTEEYHEALAESDPAKLRAELVQVAAVAVAWIEAIDRRGGAA